MQSKQDPNVVMPRFERGKRVLETQTHTLYIRTVFVNACSCVPKHVVPKMSS